MILDKNIKLAEFDDFVLNHPFGSILQTSYWARVKAEDWQPHYLAFKENNVLLACALLLERKSKVGSFFYCPRGFVLDYNNEEVLKEVIELSKSYASQNRGFLLRFDPEIALKVSDSRSLETLLDNSKYYQTICKYAKGLELSLDMSASSQPRFQMLVNLDPNKDLIQNIKSKKRRLVKANYLETRGITIIEDTSEHGVKEFARLSILTEQRQNIFLRNEQYFMNMYQAFKEKNFIKIYFASIDLDKLIKYNQSLENNQEEITRLEELKKTMGNNIYTNGIICIYGTPIVQMFYGASDENFAKYKPGYAMHFQAMLDAQKDGYKYFNLGGVQGTLDDGLSRFKTEFHPELFEYIGDFDIVINPIKYTSFIKGLPLLKTIKRKLAR